MHACRGYKNEREECRSLNAKEYAKFSSKLPGDNETMNHNTYKKSYTLEKFLRESDDSRVEMIANKKGRFTSNVPERCEDGFEILNVVRDQPFFSLKNWYHHESRRCTSSVAVSPYVCTTKVEST